MSKIINDIVVHKSNDAFVSDRYNYGYGLVWRLMCRVVFPSPEEDKLRQWLKTEVYEKQPLNIAEMNLFKLIDTYSKLPINERYNEIGMALNREIENLHFHLRTQ